MRVHFLPKLKSSVALAIKVCATLGTLAVAGPLAQAQSNSASSFAVTDGEVRATATIGDTLFIGGNFRYIGDNTGSAAIFRLSNGKAATSRMPTVVGTVHCSEPDGQGGWFFGGQFTSVNGSARANLAHIKADGTLDAWAPNPNKGVFALEGMDNFLYVGGEFTTIGGVARSGFARYDSLGVLQTFKPVLNGYVYALERVDTTIVAGGTFTTVTMGATASTRNRIAQFSPWGNSLGVLKTYNPNANGTVWALAKDTGNNNALYVGGNFTSIGGQTRQRVARLFSGGTADMAFSANANANVYALARSGAYLFVGGEFTTIKTSNRSYFAAVAAATGVVATFDADLDDPDGGIVHGLSASGGKVFAAGKFRQFDGLYRVGSVAINPATLAVDATWSGLLNGNAYTVCGAAGYVFVGGSFSSAGGALRDRLAALRLSSGTLLPWAPNANGEVLALEVLNKKLYVGGDFTTISALGRTRMARYNAATLALDSWSFSVDGNVNAMAAVNGKLWIGGAFTSAGGSTRNNVAVINTGGTLSTTINPDANAEVHAIRVFGSKVVLGGSFSKLNGNVGHKNVGAVDTANGNTTSWDPDPNDVVRALATDGSWLYIGGDFTSIDGSNRGRLARVNTSYTLSTFSPAADAAVRALAIHSGVLYVGGAFSAIGGSTRNRAASYTISTNGLGTWNPNLGSGNVHAMALIGTSLWAGGTFALANGNNLTGVAKYVITSGTAPLAALDMDYCGDTLAKTGKIAALANSAIGTYEFEFSRNGNVLAIVAGLPNRRFINLTHAELQYGLSYVVRVRGTGTGGTGAWSTSSCTITLIADPALLPAQGLRAADCGSTHTTSQSVSAQRVKGASRYHFSIYSDAALQNLVASANTVGSFLSLAGRGLVAGNTYHITVETTVDGITTPVGPACTLAIAAPGIRDGAPEAGTAVQPLLVYPNPTADAWNIQQPDPAAYRIVDVTGRVVASGTATSQTSLGAHLPAGCYSLQVEGHQPVQLIKQ